MNIVEYADKMSNMLLRIAMDLGYLTTLTDNEKIFEGISDLAHDLMLLAGVESPREEATDHDHD